MSNIDAITKIRKTINKAILVFNGKRLRDKKYMRVEKIKKDDEIIAGLQAAKNLLIELERENIELKVLLKKEGVLNDN